jgi:hypothetical protein
MHSTQDDEFLLGHAFNSDAPLRQGLTRAQNEHNALMFIHSAGLVCEKEKVDYTSPKGFF